MRIPLFIFDVVTPGTWLDYDNPACSFEMSRLIDQLKSQFFEANAALNLFIARPPSDQVPRANWQNDTDRRNALQTQLECSFHGTPSDANREELRFQADILLKRESWERGHVPRELQDPVALIYARAFLHALDLFEKFLKVLASLPQVPGGVADSHRQFLDAFPDLRGVRNTAQHLEDRARGLGPGNKPLDIKPQINTATGTTGARFLALNWLLGSRYGHTMSNGEYGEIDVSHESMIKVQRILRDVLCAFTWKGPKQHQPSA